MDGKFTVSALNSIMLNTIDKLDKDEREASIFAILCTFKMKFPDEFEAALITFLRHGTEVIDDCGKEIGNAED